MSKSLRHEKAPSVAALRASEINAVIDQENNVMANNSTNVVPFNFGEQQVRTLLVDGEPWFSVQDILGSLEYTESYKPARATAHIPEQWKGVHRLHTPGGSQQTLMLSEQGLYFFLGRSDKKKAIPFQMWVAGEVLPEIRRTGRYEDHQAKMPTLIDELIGMSELSVIKGLIRDKGKAIAADKRQSFALTMHNRLHTRFNVPRTELIPAGQFEAACNFIAAYNVLEGEFIAKEPPQLQLPLNIHYPIEALAAIREGMLTVRNDKQAWLDVTLDDVRDTRDGSTPLESLLWDLEKAGFDIRGAWWELRTYRNKLREITSFVKGLGRVMEEPQRYAVDTPKGRAAA